MNTRGVLCLLAGIGLFSTIEVASKLMQTGGGIAGRFPFWLAALRFMIAGCVLLFPAQSSLRRRNIRLGGRDVLVLVSIGLLGVTLMSSLYHLSITFLPANVAALVFSCNPVFVVLLAALVLKERITVRKLTAAALCLLGIALLAVGQTAPRSATGLLLMLAALSVFALYTVAFKKLLPTYGALPLTAFGGLSGGVCILPLALLAEGMPLPDYGVADWVGIAWLSLAGTALAYFLFVYGMGHVEAGLGSMVFFLKPFLAALLARIVLGEVLTAGMIGGGVLILGGMSVALLPVEWIGCRLSRA